MLLKPISQKMYVFKSYHFHTQNFYRLFQTKLLQSIGRSSPKMHNEEEK